MSDMKQICDFALHKFLEKIEEAILDGFKIHKTPATYAKLIGGRYTVTMVKPAEVLQEYPVEITASVIPNNGTPEPEIAKPTTRGRKKADES